MIVTNCFYLEEDMKMGKWGATIIRPPGVINQINIIRITLMAEFLI
jgi:hypothetical protein